MTKRTYASPAAFKQALEQRLRATLLGSFNDFMAALSVIVPSGAHARHRRAASCGVTAGAVVVETSPGRRPLNPARHADTCAFVQYTARA